MPQLVVNMNITLLNLIYLQVEKLELLKRHAAYLNRWRYLLFLSLSLANECISTI